MSAGAEDLGELERRVESLRTKLEAGRVSSRRETLLLAAWGALAVFLCWDDVTWWRGELPVTVWGWVKTLAWPLVIYSYLALVALSAVQLLTGRDVAIARSQLEEALAALEASRERP